MYNQQNNIYGMGYAQTQPTQPALMTQALTPEQISELKKNNSSEFTLPLTPVEILKAKCTHKENGKFATIEGPDGSLTCTICGAVFKPSELTQIQVAEVVQAMEEILRSIQLYFVDMPEEVAKQFFTIIPLLAKVPALYKIAKDNFAKYDHTQQVNNNYMNGFNAINALIGGMNPYAPSQPIYAQQGYQQAPMGMPGMGMSQPQQFDPSINASAVQPGYNMFTGQQTYGQPMGMQNGYAPQPQAPIPGAPVAEQKDETKAAYQI